MVEQLPVLKSRNTKYFISVIDNVENTQTWLLEAYSLF